LKKIADVVDNIEICSEESTPQEDENIVENDEDVNDVEHSDVNFSGKL